MWRRVGGLVQVRSARIIALPLSIPVRYQGRPTAIRTRQEKGNKDKKSPEHNVDIINHNITPYRYPPRCYSMSELAADSSPSSPQFTLTQQEQTIFNKVIQAVRPIQSVHGTSYLIIYGLYNTTFRTSVALSSFV